MRARASYRCCGNCPAEVSLRHGHSAQGNWRCGNSFTVHTSYAPSPGRNAGAGSAYLIAFHQDIPHPEILHLQSYCANLLQGRDAATLAGEPLPFKCRRGQVRPGGILDRPAAAEGPAGAQGGAASRLVRRNPSSTGDQPVAVVDQICCVTGGSFATRPMVPSTNSADTYRTAVAARQSGRSKSNKAGACSCPHA